MSAFTEARSDEFEELLELYGSKLTYSDTDYYCLADPVESEKQMTPSAYQPDRMTQFSMRLADWTASGMGLRSTFTYLTKSYSIVTLKEDPADATVMFRAVLLK